MARRTKEEALATRDSILEAAAKVFVERGVSRATLEEIANEAGVTRGAVYWHFENKTDIFLALHDKLHVPFTEAVLEGLEGDHDNPLEKLEELCVHLLRDVVENPQKRQIVTILLLRCDYAEDMEKVLVEQRERRKKSFQLFDRYFERAKKKGLLSPAVDPHILTVSLFCYLNGIVLEAIRYPGCVKLEAQAAPLLRQFFGGLGCKAGRL